jgi:hypothetical protein
MIEDEGKKFYGIRQLLSVIVGTRHELSLQFQGLINPITKALFRILINQPHHEVF